LGQREDLTHRTLAFIRKAAPFAYCDACLALRLEASLMEIAEVLARLTVDGGRELERRLRACYGCGRTVQITALHDGPPRRR
jgi:hypothetical protein